MMVLCFVQTAKQSQTMEVHYVAALQDHAIKTTRIYKPVYSVLFLYYDKLSGVCFRGNKQKILPPSHNLPPIFLRKIIVHKLLR
jgi:hypothetical protein